MQSSVAGCCCKQVVTTELQTLRFLIHTNKKRYAKGRCWSLEKNFAFNRPAVEETSGYAYACPPISFFHGPVSASFFLHGKRTISAFHEHCL
jgi:hypothetical protein